MHCERTMVKEVKLQGCIDGIEAQEVRSFGTLPLGLNSVSKSGGPAAVRRKRFIVHQAVFSLLFRDDQFARRYHKEQNDDPYAEVSDWTADGLRTVKFSATISAPKVLKKFVGVDILNVTELQQYSATEDTFTVTSRPTAKHPHGFSVKVEMVLSPAEKQNGCVISTTVILECRAAVWGVQGTIESFMERKAKSFFWGWLRFARLYLMEQVALANGLPYTGKEEELPEAAVLNDEFFDFSEQDEKALNLTGESQKLGVIYSREGEAGLQNWVMQTVMGQLNGLHITCNASRSHVEELNRRLQKMEEDILQVQKRLEDGPFCKEWMVWRFTFTCVLAGVLFGAGNTYFKSRCSK